MQNIVYIVPIIFTKVGKILANNQIIFMSEKHCSKVFSLNIRGKNR
jgi:hypothetical protein